MTPDEFRWNVMANLASAIILFVLGAAFYLFHQRQMAKRGER